MVALLTYHARCTGSFHKSWHKFSFFFCLHASLLFLFRFLSCLFFMFQNFNTSWCGGLTELLNFNVWRGRQRSTTAWTRFLEESGRTGQEPKEGEESARLQPMGGVWGPSDLRPCVQPPPLPSNRLSDRPWCKVMPRLPKQPSGFAGVGLCAALWSAVIRNTCLFDSISLCRRLDWEPEGFWCKSRRRG